MSTTEDLVDQFRGVSLDRLAVIEKSWMEMVQGTASRDMIECMRREVHTLKGESSMVAYADVQLLSEKLEHLFALALERPRRISEEVDLLVSMAIQFTAMLLRRKSGQAISGIDLEGFAHQVDEALALARAEPSDDLVVARGGPRAMLASGRVTSTRVPAATLESLGAAAAATFLETLSATGARRKRLNNVWLLLRSEIEALESFPLAACLSRHVEAGEEVARRLEKEIQVEIDIPELQLPVRLLEALDVASLHLVRNAIDHGIEPRAQRAAAGKPSVGRVTLRARVASTSLILTVEDDGGGVDFEKVRAKARAAGLLGDGAGGAAEAGEGGDLKEVLFTQGFSTRDEITEVSGRGVGLDAVRASVREIQGQIDLESELGKGTLFTLTVPMGGEHVAVHELQVPRAPLTFVVATDWSATVESIASLGPDVIDLMDALEIEPDPLEAVVAPEESRHAILVLRRGGSAVRLLTSATPLPGSAQRVCKTGEAHAVEVVELSGKEALLVRPEHLVRARSPASRARFPVSRASNPKVMNSERSQLVLAATLRDGQRTMSAYTLSLSGESAFVRTDETLEIGARVQVELAFPGLLAARALTGRVAACHHGSRPGEPAGVTLMFDLRSSADAGFLARLLQDATFAEVASPVRSFRILYVDRSQFNRLAFARAVEQRSDHEGSRLEVDLARNGFEADALTLSARPDLTIVDWTLEDGHGDELIRTVRGIPDDNRRAVLATASTASGVRERLLAAGADMFIERPFSMRDLVFTLGRLIELRGDS